MKKFTPPPRGYYKTHRAAVEALLDGGISIGAFALYNLLAYYGWKEGKAALTTAELSRHLKIPITLISQWLGELEWRGLVQPDGDGWTLVEALKHRGQEQSSLDRSAGVVWDLREGISQDRSSL